MRALRCRWRVGIARQRAQFAHFPGESPKPETRWRERSRFELSGDFEEMKVAPVCGELLISVENQQFATHRTREEQAVTSCSVGEALKILAELHATKGESCDYVFVGRSGERPRADLQKLIGRVIESSKVDLFRTHDLRRTVGTGLGSLGTQLTVIKKVLNHSEKSKSLYTGSFDQTETRGSCNYSRKLKSRGIQERAELGLGALTPSGADQHVDVIGSGAATEV